eukprot:gb/GEZN01005677.1/.p1 GENE.gb/GEZN01005677.1/~~gb/GEZN01005677.1/.p1  ORF type:complete len:571 (-),score=43.28 gb/GEZN01005677.1/:31-1743(-)
MEDLVAAGLSLVFLQSGIIVGLTWQLHRFIRDLGYPHSKKLSYFKFSAPRVLAMCAAGLFRLSLATFPRPNVPPDSPAIYLLVFGFCSSGDLCRYLVCDLLREYLMLSARALYYRPQGEAARRMCVMGRSLLGPLGVALTVLSVVSAVTLQAWPAEISRFLFLFYLFLLICFLWVLHHKLSGQRGIVEKGKDLFRNIRFNEQLHRLRVFRNCWTLIWCLSVTIAAWQSSILRGNLLQEDEYSYGRSFMAQLFTRQVFLAIAFLFVNLMHQQVLRALNKVRSDSIRPAAVASSPVVIVEGDFEFKRAVAPMHLRGGGVMQIIPNKNLAGQSRRFSCPDRVGHSPRSSIPDKLGHSPRSSKPDKAGHSPRSSRPDKLGQSPRTRDRPDNRGAKEAGQQSTNGGDPEQDSLPHNGQPRGTEVRRFFPFSHMPKTKEKKESKGSPEHSTGHRQHSHGSDDRNLVQMIEEFQTTPLSEFRFRRIASKNVDINVSPGVDLEGVIFAQPENPKARIQVGEHMEIRPPLHSAENALVSSSSFPRLEGVDDNQNPSLNPLVLFEKNARTTTGPVPHSDQ